MTENKAEICEKLGELLKLTRAGEHIDRIEYDGEKDCAVVYCKDKYGRLPVIRAAVCKHGWRQRRTAYSRHCVGHFMRETGRNI